MGLFNRYNTSQAELLINLANNATDTINITSDFKEYVTAFNNLIDYCKRLKSYERKLLFSGMRPSDNLESILAEKPFSEKDFLCRFSYANELKSLEKYSSYAASFTVSSQKFFNALLYYSARPDGCFDDSHRLDAHIKQVAEFAAADDAVSLGKIQRHFNISFSSALELINQLEFLGIVDQENGTKPRNIMVTSEALDLLLSNIFISDNAFSCLTLTDSINYDSMDGIGFENFCVDLLGKNGYYNISTTSASGDQGIDIIAFKDGVKYGIQCKCYSADIGNKAVQEVFSGSRFYDCHVPVVLTNRYFTKGAQELAAKTNVLLWDRNKLNELIKNSI